MIINLLTNYELADIEIIPDQGSTAVALDHGITQFNNTFVHLVLIELNSRFDLDLLEYSYSIFNIELLIYCG
jgi:hypothetical protein